VKETGRLKRRGKSGRYRKMTEENYRKKRG